jgi:hypothetical protein
MPAVVTECAPGTGRPGRLELVSEPDDGAVRHDGEAEHTARPGGARERERLERRRHRHELGRPEITELELGKTTHKVAEVEPMDVDGVRTMTIGTIMWGVLALAMLPFLGNLESAGRMWWIWTAIAGFGLGLIGVEYCRRRRNALQLQPGRRRRVD